MKMLFCNITYMNNYIGITEDDSPNGGGSYVTENKDACEQWNFLNENGYCYGFVMNNGDRFSIERIDPRVSNSDVLEDVTVVWCANKENVGTVIVGWYEHATVYREYQFSMVTPLHGVERSYFTKAKAEDCYLLPNYARTFTIGRAAQDGKGRGFGQQNYWYAESAYAQSELIPAVAAYLETQKGIRINYISADFEDKYADTAPVTEAEKKVADTYWDNGEYFRFLPYAYRLYRDRNDIADAYDVAKALSYVYQYDKSIAWYHRIIETEGENWISLSALPYLYQQTNRFKKSIEVSMKLLDFEESKELDVKHELYSIIADNLYHLNKIDEAIAWLDKVLSESNDDGLIEHTKSVKDYWMSLT